MILFNCCFRKKGSVIPLSVSGKRIKNLREERGLSQLEFAERIGMSNSVLSRIESGKRPIEDNEINIFADFLKYPVTIYWVAQSQELLQAVVHTWMAEKAGLKRKTSCRCCNSSLERNEEKQQEQKDK